MSLEHGVAAHDVLDARLEALALVVDVVLEDQRHARHGLHAVLRPLEKDRGAALEAAVQVEHHREQAPVVFARAEAAVKVRREVLPWRVSVHHAHTAHGQCGTTHATRHTAGTCRTASAR